MTSVACFFFWGIQYASESNFVGFLTDFYNWIVSVSWIPRQHLICCGDDFSELCLVFLESFSCEQNAKLGLKGQTFSKMITSLSFRTIRCPKVSTFNIHKWFIALLSFLVTGCNCSSVGAVNNVCNNMTGDCDCEPFVTGKSCDRCEQYAYNYTEFGCLPCNCSSFGSTDLQCDSVRTNSA